MAGLYHSGSEAFRNDKIRYISGFIESKRDGDLHYLGAMRLRDLYGVMPSECIVKEKDTGQKYYDRGMSAKMGMCLCAGYQ